MKNLLIALSLANLAYLRIWHELLNGKIAYYAKEAPLNHLWALGLNVTLLGVALWAGVQFAKKTKLPAGIAQVAFLLLALVVARVHQPAFDLRVHWGWAGVALWMLLLSVLLVFVMYLRPLAVRLVAMLLLIASPYLLVTFGRGAWEAYKIGRMSFADKPTAAPLPPRSGTPHVLWIVFDELDQRLIYEARPPTVKMPEFDRLRAVSFYARQAYAPARMTEMAMPALISGELVSRAEPEGADELMVTLGESEEWLRWRERPNVFRTARQLGFNTAVVGWYHPYCRVLNQDLTWCEWEDGPMLRGALRRRVPVLDGMWEQARDVIYETLGLAHFGWDPRLANTAEREEEVRDHLYLLDLGKRLANDRSFGLAMVHLPMPHPVGIYDRFTDRFDTDTPSTYLDNLELADWTLGELRRAMEAAGTWDDTTVIVSGDHWWRAEIWQNIDTLEPEEWEAFGGQVDHRVAFLVKFAGQKQKREYAPEFNTVLTRGLIEAVLRGKVAGPQDAARWLSQNKTIGESPYNVVPD